MVHSMTCMYTHVYIVANLWRKKLGTPAAPIIIEYQCLTVARGNSKVSRTQATKIGSGQDPSQWLGDEPCVFSMLAPVLSKSWDNHCW